jgi:putative ubiquitin-RnfH superfamily antitoxin RatB of RatAB toxin-antitoxin module
VTEQQIEVEVVYARQHAQALLAVKGPPGLTVADAIERSGIRARFPEIDPEVNKVGIFGKLAALDQPLQSGDRVEIYPPLIADPKQARKQRAARGAGERKGGKGAGADDQQPPAEDNA